MKCARPKCLNKGSAAWGLCDKHYDAIPRGFVDAAPTRAHCAKLRAAGMSWDLIAETSGVGRSTLIEAGKWSHNGGVRLETQRRVLSIDIPPLVRSGCLVSAVGTRRRVQALQAIGWPLSRLGAELGRGELGATRSRSDQVQARTAVEVAELFARLELTPGPSSITKIRAARKGWPPPLAWDDIDDPDEHPDLREDSKLSFPERYLELREHVGLSDVQIANKMGIELESLERQLFRYDMFKGRAA